MCEEEETRTPTSRLTLPPQSSASTNSATSPFHKTIQCNRCPEQDSNLHVSQHSHLKRARLPFRHLGKRFCKIPSFRAENEARTRDPNLGKVVLYQLSYFRIRPVLFVWDCKGTHFFETSKLFFKLFFHFFEKYVNNPKF